MAQLKVNLLESKRAAVAPAHAGTAPARFFISPLLLAGVFLSFFILGRLSLTETGSIALAELNQFPILSQMRHLIMSPDRKIKGEDEDRINILLLGMGGEGHDGPNLTDTIIVASYRPSTQDVALLSIPRDLLVPIPPYGWRKINAVNAFGELNSPGRGSELARTTMEGLLGVDIPYHVRVDFDGFREMIDAVDGIDIYVERSFTDYTYPTENHGIQVVSFEQGWQHMDGEEALRFARSRHGNAGEGSDFARAKRQQKVLSALKDKMLSADTFRSPVVIANTLAALQSHIDSNIHIGEILRLMKMVRDIDRVNISHKVLDNGRDSTLVDRIIGGAYVLVPRNNDWQLLRDVTENIFTEAEQVEADTPPPPSDRTADYAVEILNGTGVPGHAREMAGELSKLGYTIIKIGNAANFDFSRSIIVDLTTGGADDILEHIEQVLGGDAARDTESQAYDHSPEADILIILGRNSLPG